MRDMKNGDLSAFPEVYQNEHGAICSTDGLTKREYFAVMAMQGILSGNWNVHELSAVNRAVDFADALLTALYTSNQEG